MATETEKYGFVKPAPEDPVNIEDLNGNFDKIEAELSDRVKTINGSSPDSDGNIKLDTGAGTVKCVNGILPDDNGNSVIPETVDLTIDWTNGTYTETLSDGTIHTEDITFNENGMPVAFGGMTFSMTGV